MNLSGLTKAFAKKDQESHEEDLHLEDSEGFSLAILKKRSSGGDLEAFPTTTNPKGYFGTSRLKDHLGALNAMRLGALTVTGALALGVVATTVSTTMRNSADAALVEANGKYAQVNAKVSRISPADEYWTGLTERKDQVRQAAIGDISYAKIIEIFNSAINDVQEQHPEVGAESLTVQSMMLANEECVSPNPFHSDPTTLGCFEVSVEGISNVSASILADALRENEAIPDAFVGASDQTGGEGTTEGSHVIRFLFNGGVKQERIGSVLESLDDAGSTVQEPGAIDVVTPETEVESTP